MKKQSIFKTIVLVIGVAALSVATTAITNSLSEKNVSDKMAVSAPTRFASETLATAVPTDFTMAAENSVNSVVHVKTTFQTQTRSFGNDPFFDFFFGRPDKSYPQQQEQVGTGSGVIISEDGYIITNNHVVQKSTNVEVTLNDKRSFKATVIGTDPSTDIALLKIDAKDLPIIPFGNSDALKVGEWVLAVGNPFNLTSTVTAGIVSAKARNINILNADMKIEAFIQTDAAVNPGNSGGALVNTRGELIGINTAIASQTGSYTGYSFAVPISIASKVVADLKEFGVVQRAVLGVEIRDINDEFAKEKKLNQLNGAYVAKVSDNSAAKIAGIEEGDIIVNINGTEVKSVAQLQEQIGRYRPGDKITVSFVRKGKTETRNIELKNRSGSTAIVKAVDMSTLGASFEPISDQLKYNFQIAYGIQVTSVTKNGLFAKNGIEKGFVILKINNSVMRTESDIENIFTSAMNNNDQEKAMFVSGFYPNTRRIAHYAINLNENNK
ncbi:MAG: Do family serine endopeptidase [Paludibacteraceae bacterium]|jgi:serine protease Do|nr:Do family serine endopeptidase [Paludibacteraceae bacterium]